MRRCRLLAADGLRWQMLRLLPHADIVEAAIADA